MVSDDQNTLRAGPRGPAALEDFHFREKIFHFDHERIPERVVHARGFGAHGFFESNGELEAVSRAAVFKKGEAEEKPVRTKGNVVALLLTQRDLWCQWVEGLPESLLTEHVRQPGGALRTRFEMLVGTKDHEMHHRGQLMLMERMLGIVPHLTRNRQARQNTSVERAR